MLTDEYGTLTQVERIRLTAALKAALRNTAARMNLRQADVHRAALSVGLAFLSSPPKPDGQPVGDAA